MSSGYDRQDKYQFIPNTLLVELSVRVSIVNNNRYVFVWVEFSFS